MCQPTVFHQNPNVYGFPLPQPKRSSRRQEALTFPLRPDRRPNARSRFRIVHSCWLILLSLWLGSTATAAQSSPWREVNGYRWQPLEVPISERTGFTLLAPEATGITFTNLLVEERSLTNRILMSGSGLAAGDIDGDGACDLYFCRIGGPNALYRNLGGWKFEDVTAMAGVACSNQDSTGAVFADTDGDGDVDLLVNSLGEGTRLFQNDGKGQFSDITAAAGVATKAGSTSMALADVDGDGDLDLYVANFRPTTIMDSLSTTFRVSMVSGRPVVALVNGRPTTDPDLTNRFVVAPSGKVFELGEVDRFYFNDGQGRFSLAPFTAGTFFDEDGKALVEPPRDFGLAVQFHDLNDDGAPDIYVCNDLYTPDRIWVNDGRGRFRALARLSLRCISTFSMGVDFADIDRDGHVDFFVTDMLSREHLKRQVQVAESSPSYSPVGLIDNRPQLHRNTLQWNRGDGTFADVAYYGGVEATEWSWGPIFLDVDLDGFEDLLVPNGQLGDFQNIDMAQQIEAARAARRLTPAELVKLVKLYPRLETARLAFRNTGDLRFADTSKQWGFNESGISQGMALADLDNDGDLDVVVNNLNAAAGLYRNDGAAPRIAIRLRGGAANTQGIGARITITGGPMPQTQEVIAGGRYLSGADPLRVFAAGGATNTIKIDVSWRSGKRTIIDGAQPNCLYEISETHAGDAVAQTPPKADPYFEEAGHLINHAHRDEPFVDFDRQPLLPKRLSQPGPGVAWCDLDADGWEDLIIASGKSGMLTVFHNEAGRAFSPVMEPWLRQATARDQTGVLGFSNGTNVMLLAGLSNYEDGQASGFSVQRYEFAHRTAGGLLPAWESSAGPLALADVDADGDLDLFVGGRVVPGRYPVAASSRFFRREAGEFKAAPESAKVFESVGLVNGAVFSDLDADGYPELLLACEWGPIQIFTNQKGVFHPSTNRPGLSELHGWWNGVTTGDLDGDGRLDILASNWGLNTKYRANNEHPRRIYYGDLDGNGTMDVIEAYHDAGMGKEVPERELGMVASVMPFLRERFKTFEQFGQQSVAEIFGDRLKQAKSASANTLASMAFLNRGNRFEAVVLPAEAQLSPAFSVNVADFDGDGSEDVFLSQNFFATEPRSPRNDAGRGLWLKGDGRGGLRGVAGQESGVLVYGEQRGAAVGDYDRDGRVDLVVSQNGAPTSLFRNRRAKPGLRVRLNAGPSNPTGVGAVIRLKYGPRFGPAREVHAGSGYWSQDSAVQVLALPEAATELWVHWPGGKTTTTALPAGAREVSINMAGKLQLLH
jgi:hypothetical protein